LQCRRRAVVAAGDYVRAKTPLRSVFPLTSIAPTALTSTFMLSRRCRVGCDCRRRSVVAAGDYVRAKTPLRSVFPLTSIAPTHAAVASVAIVVVARSSLRAITSTSIAPQKKERADGMTRRLSCLVVVEHCLLIKMDFR
jgi:hypothetical protein